VRHGTTKDEQMLSAVLTNGEISPRHPLTRGA
jgi:hypothetical protein